MAKYIICYMATGGVEIEADSAEEARKKFDELDQCEIEENLTANGWDVTGIFEDVEQNPD